MKFNLWIGLLAAIVSVSAYADVASATINQSHMLLTLASFFAVGILLAFTPCVLPMVPILSAILIGQEEKNTRKAFRLSVVFVLSMALTYAVAGMLVGYLGSTLQTLMQQPWIIASFSMVFVLMALSMFGYFHLALPSILQSRFNRMHHRLHGGNDVSVAVMGVLSTLIASPCVTAPLVSVLTFISQTGSALQGGLILFVLALGMGVPLVLFGVGQATLLPKAGAWMEQIKTVFGVMILGMAIWMIARIIPAEVTMFLWAMLFIVSAVAFGALDFHAEKRLPPVLHGVSVLVLAYGLLLLTGAASGHDNPFNPLQAAYAINSANDTPRPPSSLFTYVQTQSAFKAKLAAAKAEQKPVMVEFFATWCPFCKEVDKNVLSDVDIRKQMTSFVTLRVDVSERNPELASMMEEYHVYGVPTMLFFDKSGKAYPAEGMRDGITINNLSTVLKELA